VQFNRSSSIFETRPVIPEDAQVIFVADMFVDDYVGGAELTTEALIRSSPYRVFKLRSRDVTPELMKTASDRFWIFGNFANLTPQLLGLAMSTLRYSVVEYDYKYCRFRSPEKHQHSTGVPCDCVGQTSGRLVSNFYRRSMGMWWMSERQLDRYTTAFPFLADGRNCVLSSVFEKATLERIADLHAGAPACRRGWLVLGSDSWVKGADEAEDWCKREGKEYEVVWGVPYDDLLSRMSRAEGFVYLPKGGDTCPRMVIEAKLLGCKLHINDNVQHAHEAWFDTDELQDVQDHLMRSPERFWSGIKEMIAKRKLLLKQQKAAGKSVTHLERANARAAKELATFEARLQDFEKRRAAAKDLAPNPARPPKTRTAVAPVPKTVPRPGRHAAQR
jgi:hypothetical protein